MKILIVTTVSGTMNFFENQIATLLENGYEVHLAANFNYKNIKFDLSNVVTHQIDFSRSVKSLENLKAYLQLKKLLKKESFEIIHTHTPIASAVVRMQKKINKEKIVYTAHGFHFFKGSPKKNWLIFYPLEKILAKRTDVLITINEEDNELSNKKLHPKRVENLPGVGINLKKFDKGIVNEIYYNELNLTKEDFIITCVGELNKNKNQEFLIQLMKELSKEKKSIKLLIVGDGKLMNYLKALSADYKLSDSIRFLGYRQDISEILEISDLVISVSYREGLPVNLMEAMANGKPLIVSDTRGNRDIVKNGINGYIIKNYNLEEYKKIILKISSDSELYSYMSKNSLELSKRYGMNSINKELLSIYDSLKG